MSDFYPLIAHAVARLDKNTGGARRAVYARARTTLVTELHSVDPPLDESHIVSEWLALEEAIRKVEAESLRRALAELGTPKSMLNVRSATPKSLAS
jgi:hypothetical protein